MTDLLPRDAQRLARAGGWELVQLNYNHRFYDEPDHKQ